MKSVSAKRVGRSMRRIPHMAHIVGLLLTLAMTPAHAKQDESVESTFEIPVTTVQTRPDLGIIKNVVVKRAGSALAISGAVHVDPPRGTKVVSMKPARIKIELLDPEGKVREDKSLLLGPHGLHTHDGQLPTFATHLEAEPQKGERLRIYIEDEHKY